MKRWAVESIKDRIEQLIQKGAIPHATVEWRDSHQKAAEQAVATLNASLSWANEEERLTLATDLFRLWCDAARCRGKTEKLQGDEVGKKAEEEAPHIFGKLFELYGDWAHRGLLYTLNGKRTQLRVWYGIPSGGDGTWATSVDSAGENLLFGVYGNPQILQSYLAAFQGIRKLHEMQGPCGSLVFI